MPKKQNNLALGISEPEKVDEFMNHLNHPLMDVVKYLRKIILSTDVSIGEGIYWNAPTFYYTGKMEPFEPKEYKRYLVGFVFNKQDCVRLVFLRGGQIEDESGLLEGDYKDGRRLATFKNIEEVKNKESALKTILSK
ncbi:MAG TPA: DUF1801 domain-containing protein, partial [Tenuifilaceae bacterium]|nr:DUF1801 domain-containing protein [Tenuifilaceae bacterium]